MPGLTAKPSSEIVETPGVTGIREGGDEPGITRDRIHGEAEYRG
jgi:hypothetical protein